jgi:hypothetical protein
MATVLADLAAAGFTDLTFERLSERSRMGSAQEAAIATCQGGVLRGHIESHAPGRLEEITEMVAAALAEKFGTGPIDAPMQAILSHQFARLRFSADIPMSKRLTGQAGCGTKGSAGRGRRRGSANAT